MKYRKIDLLCITISGKFISTVIKHLRDWNNWNVTDMGVYPGGLMSEYNLREQMDGLLSGGL